MTYTKLGDSDRAAEARQTYVALRGETSFFPFATLHGMASSPPPVVRPGAKAPRP